MNTAAIEMYIHMNNDGLVREIPKAQAEYEVTLITCIIDDLMDGKPVSVIEHTLWRIHMSHQAKARHLRVKGKSYSAQQAKQNAAYYIWQQFKANRNKVVKAQLHVTQ